MQAIKCVLVPTELAGNLTAAGFDQAATVRGFGVDAILTVTSITANLVTILVAKDQLTDLLKRLRDWMARSTAPDQGSEFVLDVSAQVGRDRCELRLVSRRSIVGDPPQVDLAGLDALLASAFDDHTR